MRDAQQIAEIHRLGNAVRAHRKIATHVNCLLYAARPWRHSSRYNWAQTHLVKSLHVTNPVLVELTRSDRVESVHRGAIAVWTRAARCALPSGDVEAPVYPRSSLKPVQAIPLIESGAAAMFGLGSEEIALACASHSGEPQHTARIAAWQAKIGCSVADLACGPHRPTA